MNEKLCCLVKSHVTCYYCQEMWCEECYSKVLPPYSWREGRDEENIWKGSSCPKGNFPGRWGGHYTMVFGKGVLELSKVESYRRRVLP